MEAVVLISPQENDEEILGKTLQESFVLHAHIWLNEELLGHAGTWAQILVMMHVWPGLTSHHTHRQGEECDWRDGQMDQACKNMHVPKTIFRSLMECTMVAQCHNTTLICYVVTSQFSQRLQSHYTVCHQYIHTITSAKSYVLVLCEDL